MERAALDAGVVQSRAPGGLTVVTEALPGARGVALGVFVRFGTRDEARAQMGVAHLLEHLVFKGTDRRGPRELARAIEGRGGALDAFTARDHTGFQAHVLGRDLAVAAEVLTDLVRRPLLRDEDLDLERNVVLEEIRAVEDTPDDLVHDLHAQTLWPDDAHGFPILGTAETVAGLRARDLRAVHAAAYGAGNCVIAAAGAVEHDALLEALAAEGWLDAPSGPPVRRQAPAPALRAVERVVERDSAQVHVVVGTDTFGAGDPRRFALAMLVNAVGGGMGSRLFQRVREELGLAYGVWTATQLYHETGQLGTYVGSQPQTAAAALQAIREEYARVAAHGLAPGELEEAREQLKGQLVLGLEGAGARMARLAGTALAGLPYRPVDALLADVDAVRPDDVAALAAEYFAPERQTVVRLGPLD